LVSLTGKIFQVDLFSGHNNDKGVLLLSGLKDKLIKNKLNILGDRGYNYPIITPKDSKGREYNLEQQKKRSIVEIVFSFVKFFQSTSGVFKQSVEIQELCILIVYQLVAQKILENPIRI